ncbi:hypothetical protein IJ732_07700 [bacterium]|nr:hypothetical protein [bacterium]
MGLAASQCRFLMLTSRESDVEAKMMSLSNQQMALSQKATRLSADFAKAMSAQSVFFNDTAVKYSQIMQPNVVENANGKVSQYLFKTCRGNVVLSPGIADKMGINPSSELVVSTLGRKAYSGTSGEFKKLFPKGKDDFIAKMTGNTPTEYEKVTDKDGNEVTSEIQKSGYKYNDNIMNQAVVTNVQSASVLNLSGYGFDSLEYAMGVQEDNLDSYACIFTLDQYQFTESNVHSIVNDFVMTACGKMGEQLMLENNLGSSDAVQYAVNYATEKTRAYYADQNIDNQAGKTVVDMINDNKALVANGQTSTAIRVSSHDYFTTTTTSVDTSSNPTLDITTLTGKDIFVDTAQLTAVFLNYFDAGMLRSMREAVQNQTLQTAGNDNAYLTNLDSTIVAIENLNSSTSSPLAARKAAQSATENQTINGTQVAVVVGTNGVGGFNSGVQGELEDGTKENLIQTDTGSTGWFGNTAVTNNEAQSGKTGTSTLTAQREFYGHLYDALSTGGWVYNLSVDADDDYLDTQLQHGNMYLCEYTSSTDKDGKALSVDDASSGLSLVDNADKIEKAQADYEAETAKIDYKTNIIETQMKTLQTELDSIQSEKESVKAVKDKHLEKRFNIFS